MSLITSTVVDYGTRKILTKAAVQKNLYSYSAAMGFCEVDTSTTGVYRSPHSNLANVSEEQVTGDSYSVDGTTVGADILDIDRVARFAERVGGFDEASFATGSLIANRVDNAAKKMAQQIDRYVINKAVASTGSMIIDAGAVGSGVFAATPWTVSKTNALDIVNAVVEEVNFGEGYGEDKFVLIDTSFTKHLTGFFQGTGNNVADETLRQGVPYVGMLAGGVRVFQSNNVPHFAVITIGANPTASDTLTITAAGRAVTYTFVSAIGTTPGNVLIAGTAAGTKTNLLGALNAPGTTDANKVALTTENQAVINGLNLSNADVSTTIQVSAKGAFRLRHTFTSGSNTVSSVRKRLLAGAMRSVKAFVPTKGMKYQEKDAIGGFDGTEIYMRQFFNSMTESTKVPLTVSVLTI